MTSPFARLRLGSEQRAALLRGVIERVRARAGGRTPVVVFDLDGTLMDNRPRVVAILHELAEAWRDRHPEAAACCARAQASGIVYGLKENLRRLGVADEALLDEAFAFWKARFFSDPHVRHDIGVPGARDYAEACHRAGATVVYLTGRDLANMALGSFASLRDLGFPIGRVGTELVTKPTFDMPDADFKRSVAPELARLGEVVAAFDNEAVNCNLFVEAHPACTTVLLDTLHAPDPPPLDLRVRVVTSFEMEP